MQKKNNKGLTLIELIVSIAILAIVVLPLLTAFVVSVRTNAKAKEKLRAIDIAHNFMEGMEAESVKDIFTQLTFYDEKFTLLAQPGGLQSHEVCKKDGAFSYAIQLKDIPQEVENKEALVNSTIIRDASGDVVFRENADKLYRYYVSQVPSESGGKVYDALITIDGNMKNDDANPAKSIPKYNTEVTVADMEKVDLDYDAVSTKVKTISEIREDIKDAKKRTLLDEDMKYLKRTMTIDIEQLNGNPKNSRVTVKYILQCDSNCPLRDDDGTQQIDEDGNLLTEGFDKFPEEGSAYENEYTEVIYDNSDLLVTKDCYLKNVYIYYVPWYSSTQADTLSRQEQIVINNKDDVNCTIKLIKQQSVEDSKLSMAEQAYRATVTLVESAGRTKAAAKIETNLNTNISDNSYLDNQATFIYGGYQITNPKNDVFDPADEKHLHSTADKKSAKMQISTGFGVKEARARLYNVRVDIYPAGTDFKAACDGTQTPIVTLTGGLTD